MSVTDASRAGPEKSERHNARRIAGALRRFIGGRSSWPYWLGLGLSFFVLYRRLLTLGQATLGYWFNSDYLFAADVYKDIFVDRFPLRGINFSSATGLFPDIAVTSLLMFLTRNAILSTFLYGLLQFTFLTAAYLLCAHVVQGRGCGRSVYLAAVGLVLYTASILQRSYDPIFSLFLSRSHASCFAMVVLCGALGIWICFHPLRGRRSTMALGAAAVSSMLATFADPLFIPQMLVAFTLTVLILTYFNLLPPRRPWVALAVLWGGSAAGLGLARVCFDAAALSSQAALSADRFTLALNVYIKGLVEKCLRGDWLHIAVGIWLVGATILTLRLIRRHVVLQHRFGEMTESGRRLISMVLFLLLASVCCALNVIVMGVTGLTQFKDYWWSTHYQFPLFYGAVFGLALLADLALNRLPVQVFRRIHWPFASAAVAAPLILLAGTPQPGLSLLSYRPRLVETLDAIAPKYGLQYGIGGFWEMRPVNMLSKSGLRIYPVGTDLEPYHWMSNKYWYTGYPGSRFPHPTYNFVLLRDPTFEIPRDAIIKRFGDPAAEVRVDDIRILIYNRPSDDRFQNIFSCNPRLGSLMYPLDRIGDRREWLGSCLPGTVGKAEGDSRIARPGEASRGYLSFGPYAGLKPGSYRATMQISATGAAGQPEGDWDLGFYGLAPLARGTAVTGVSQVGATFDVTPAVADRTLEMRMVYSGGGNLAIHKLTIEKLR